MTFQKGFVKILLPNMKDHFALDPRFHGAGVLKIIPYGLCNIQKIRLTSHLPPGHCSTDLSEKPERSHVYKEILIH